MRGMGKTVQIRNLDDRVEDVLRAHAESAGLSLSEFLRRRLAALADDLEARDRWDAHVAALPRVPLDMDQAVADIRELRGPLP